MRKVQDLEEQMKNMATERDSYKVNIEELKQTIQERRVR